MQNKDNLIWIDLEMTGLDTDNDLIIEIATVVTDAQLNVLAEGPVMAIHQSDAVLNGMDEWNTNQHGKSGLTQRVRDSAINEAEAEAKTLEFLKQWVPERASPMLVILPDLACPLCTLRLIFIAIWMFQPERAGAALGNELRASRKRSASGHG